ncbi:DUF1365 domain-containing protein [Hahella sp. CCB-MM4]|uniref:DUF1365 domain-containing protein n=1 Tax=Hahella sp. (strain CCB-MM4) TaxID=1926491 RepID=UPI000B9B371C|nr:DUF1365 domain-containing protein [Hahella sp. CCB-MM4]OZG75322.1 DUF1365 domain-containing protein [Hahella sp. CCB-MM4]
MWRLSQMFRNSASFKHSALCQGIVRHRRHSPREHVFQYRLSMVWLDLDEVKKIDSLPFWSGGRRNLTWFRRSDYLDPQVPDLKQAVYQRLEKVNVRPQPGRVVMLGHLRQWGFCFNPVVFYFCFDDDERLYAIVAEINNTPWNERHAYVLPVLSVVQPDSAEDPRIVSLEPGADDWQYCRFDFDKSFHVSPFMPMDMRYHWRFRLHREKVYVHMKLSRQQEVIFDASLGLDKQRLDASQALRASFGYPLMCLRVLGGIYWQAFRLWRKKVPFHTHPAKQGTSSPNDVSPGCSSTNGGRHQNRTMNGGV